YRSDYAWIAIPGVIRDEKVVHQRGVTEVPGLYFLGLTWQHTRGSALLGFVDDDAAHLAGLITTNAGAIQTAARPASQRTGGAVSRPCANQRNSCDLVVRTAVLQVVARPQTDREP